MQTSTTGYRCIPLPTDEIERLRRAPRDDFGNGLEPLEASGPCRHCLRYALPGERLVLAAYSPFDRSNAYRETGPVFMHADGCAPFAGEGLPPAFAEKPLALRGYDAEQTIARAEIVVDGTAHARVAALLADPAIAFVHARSFTHGCYLFRIERE